MRRVLQRLSSDQLALPASLKLAAHTSTTAAMVMAQSRRPQHAASGDPRLADPRQHQMAPRRETNDRPAIPGDEMEELNRQRMPKGLKPPHAFPGPDEYDAYLRGELAKTGMMIDREGNIVPDPRLEAIPEGGEGILDHPRVQQIPVMAMNLGLWLWYHKLELLFGGLFIYYGGGWSLAATQKWIVERRLRKGAGAVMPSFDPSVLSEEERQRVKEAVEATRKVWGRKSRYVMVLSEEMAKGEAARTSEAAELALLHALRDEIHPTCTIYVQWDHFTIFNRLLPTLYDTTFLYDGLRPAPPPPLSDNLYDQPPKPTFTDHDKSDLLKALFAKVGKRRRPCILIHVRPPTSDHPNEIRRVDPKHLDRSVRMAAESFNLNVAIVGASVPASIMAEETLDEEPHREIIRL